MRPVIVMTQTSEFYKSDVCILHKPFINVEPLSFNLNLLDVNYDWLIFSSKKAVEYFKPYLSKLNYKKIAVIGEKTADYCTSIGLKVSFCPKDYSQEGFLKAFKTHEQSNILLPSSAAARSTLEEGLKQQNYNVQKIDLYEPVPHTKHIKHVKVLIEQGKVDAITFASSSAVRYFFEDNQNVSFNNYFVIGQQTLDTLNHYQKQGIVADIQTLDALVNKILESWEENAI